MMLNWRLKKMGISFSLPETPILFKKSYKRKKGGKIRYKKKGRKKKTTDQRFAQTLSSVSSLTTMYRLSRIQPYLNQRIWLLCASVMALKPRA